MPQHTWQPDTYEQAPTAAPHDPERGDGENGFTGYHPLADAGITACLPMGRHRNDHVDDWYYLCFIDRDPPG